MRKFYEQEGYGDLVVREEPGEIAVLGDAPRFTMISLSMLLRAPIKVPGDAPVIHVVGLRYRVVGWCERYTALCLELMP